MRRWSFREGDVTPYPRRRRRLRLHQSCFEILDQGLNDLIESDAPPVWCVPDRRFRDEIAFYYETHESKNLKGPRPKLLEAISLNDAERTATSIDIALKFADLARSMDPLGSPILYYYSAVHLFDALTNSYFRWENDRKTHGMSMKYGEDISSFSVETTKSGLFPKVVTTLLLFGQPTLTSELTCFSASPHTYTGPGEYLENFCKRTEGPIKNYFSIEELASFKLANYIAPIREYYCARKLGAPALGALLNDFITLFAAGSMARYDLMSWKNVLEGRGNSYMVHFDEVFARYTDLTIDLVLFLIEHPVAVVFGDDAYRLSSYSD